MAATTTTHADAVPRVPAWKRLGLKLKYAKDTPTEPQPEPASPSSSAPTIHPSREALVQAQKRSLDHQRPEPPAKRSKSEPVKPVVRVKPFPGSAPKTKTAGQQVWNAEERSTLPGPKGVYKAPGQAAKRIVFDDDSSEPVQVAPTPPKQTYPKTLRKSVSFTPDTKQEDSNSAQTLYDAWALGVDPTEPITEVSTEQVTSPSKPPKEPKAKKVKKEKKKKPKGSAEGASGDSKAEESTNSSSSEVPNYVRYLEQFSEDKANWKFNKNRQNDLIKHLFDIDRVPSRYNPALVQYISTTQGQARQRIAEQAENILKAIWVSENEDADLMSLDSPAARRLAYYEALQASIARYQESGAGRMEYADQKLKEVLREHEQGRRAEELLQRALGGEIFPEPSSSPASTTRTSATSSSTTTIPAATRVIETQKTAPGQITRIEVDLRTNATDEKRKRKRKARTDVSSSSESSDSSGSDSSSSDDSDDGGEATPTSKKPESFTPATKSGASNPSIPALFDANMLDMKFGKTRTSNAVRNRRG